MLQTITKSDLVALRYGTSYATSIIRQSKCLMVQEGYSFYEGKRIGRVPIHAVERILGYKLSVPSQLYHKNA